MSHLWLQKGKNSVANKVGGFGSTWNIARTSRQVFIQFEITIQFVVCGCLTTDS